MRSLNKPATQLYTAEKLKSLLNDADNNASSDWDRKFVDTLLDRFRQYGTDIYLSPLQRLHLERIASNY
jgi:ribosome assembly protein YihI (activator of Der GTPase)